MKDVIWEATDHTKQSKLLDVDICFYSKGASKEHHKDFWGVFRKLLEIEKGLLMM